MFTSDSVNKYFLGIGAYLVRLGQRVVQIENSSIILTGIYNFFFNFKIFLNRVIIKKYDNKGSVHEL